MMHIQTMEVHKEMSLLCSFTFTFHKAIIKYDNDILMVLHWVPIFFYYERALFFYLDNKYNFMG